jgi:hypothetical protein
MELLSSIMLYTLYVLGRLAIWNIVGETKSVKRVPVFSSSVQLDIRCWPKVTKSA